MTADIATSSISGEEARRAARNAGAIAAASLLSRGLQFAWQLILAPGLGVNAFGVYGTVGAFIMVGAAIPAFGMGPIVIRDVARYPEKIGKYLSATLFIQTILALLAYIGVNLAANLGGYDAAIRVFVALASISLIIDILGSMCNDLLLAQERMFASSVVTVCHIISLLILAGLGLLAGYGLLGVYVGTIIAGIGRTIAFWALLARGGVRPRWPLDKTIARLLLVNGAPLALSSFLALAYQHADKLLTTRFIGEKETGYLTVAFLIIFGVVELLNTTVLTALYPMMSRAYGDGRGTLFGYIIEKLAFFTLVLCLPIVMILSVFASEIITLLFKETYRPAADVLRILIWYALVMMVGNMFAQGMLVQNRQRRLLFIRASGLGVNLVLLAVFLPMLGVKGAAVASVCAESLALTALLINFRAEGWNWQHVLPRAARLVPVGIITLMAMLLLGRVHPLAGMIGGAGVYLMGLFVLNVLSADDWDLLYRLLAAMPGGSLVLKYWRRDVKLNW
jgi:O-antigen/teichoic acid export membrane protein